LLFSISALYSVILEETSLVLGTKACVEGCAKFEGRFFQNDSEREVAIESKKLAEEHPPYEIY